MNNTSSFLKSILALLVVGLIFSSCEKKSSQIGLDIVGDNPLTVLFSDTASVQVHSVLLDSVRTDELINNVLGVVVDPVFGTTKASLYMQYNLSLSNYSFGEQKTFDSLVLSIPYQMTTVYGDSTAPLSFKVYEMNELLDVDTSYYSNHTAEYLPTLLGEITLVPQPWDSVLIDTTMVAPHLTVRLSDELGQRLLSLDDTLYYNNSDFVDRFKGLYFEPVYTGGEGNLTFLNLYGSQSALKLYYSNSANDSLSYSFVPSSSAPSFQNFDHLDYSGADPDFYSQVIEKDSTLGEEKFYLQTLGGVDTYIRFPSLFDNENFTKYAINEAKLIITNIDPDNVFTQPVNISLLQKRYSEADSTSTYYYLGDTGGGSDYFDGYYNSTSKQYEFRITNFIQKYIAGEYESDQILMQIAGATHKGSRLIAGGSDVDLNPESHIRLEIIYADMEPETR